MSLSVNGQSQVPPGFRFHPTEEELLQYYLRKKVAFEKIDLDFIREVDLNKLEPWDIQERCKIGSTPQNDWYFFSHKDKKYPTGTRTNRATAAGFWKATGRDKVIYSNCKRIGMRKTLVFYKGRAPHGKKSDWIMHEYRLDDNTTNHETSVSSAGGDSASEDGWVVCRVFKKKNYHKALEAAPVSPDSMETGVAAQKSSNEGVLDQILAYMGRPCKQEHDQTNTARISCKNDNIKLVNPTDNNTGMTSFMQLPRLDSPTIPSLSSPYEQPIDGVLVAEPHDQPSCTNQDVDCSNTANNNNGLSDWVALDRLVAWQLNGQVETTKPLGYYGHDHDDEIFTFSLHHHHHDPQLTNLPCSDNPNQAFGICNSELDPWGMAPASSSSDPLRHLSI